MSELAKDKKVILPKKFVGQYVEDYIEAIQAANPLTFAGSIYDKCSHYIMALLHEKMGLPYKPKPEPEPDAEQEV